MDLQTGTVLAAVLLALIWLGLGTWNLRTARAYRRTARAERIRSRFAEARNQLTWKVIRGELDAESNTFRLLYFLQTAMMRRDDQYEQMWSTLVASVAQADGTVPQHPI